MKILLGSMVSMTLVVTACSSDRTDGAGTAGNGAPTKVAKGDAGRDASASGASGAESIVTGASGAAGGRGDADAGARSPGSTDGGVLAHDGQRIALFGTAGPASFTTSDFVAWLKSNGAIVERVQVDAGTPLTPEFLKGYTVIVLDQLVRSYTAEEAGLLRDWVAAGGGLAALTGYTGLASDLDNPNSLLADIGLGYVPGLQNGGSTTSVRVVTMFEMHPLTTGITSVTFAGGFLVAPQDTLSGGTNTVVASLTTGAVGIAQVRGMGRVFVWGDEWITYDSEWRTMPQIKAFWVNILGWLGHFR